MTRVRRLVYISGAPGAGKSTLAGPLAAELGYALITKDTIKETLHDALGSPEADLAWSRRLGGASMELLWTLAARAPEVVIEANFRPYSEFERERLSALGGFDGSGGPPAQARRTVEVHCACPPEIASARYNARAAHPVHVIKALPVSAMAEYDRPVGIGALITVDTTCPVDVAAIAAQIRQHHAAG